MILVGNLSYEIQSKVLIVDYFFFNFCLCFYVFVSGKLGSDLHENSDSKFLHEIYTYFIF